MSAAVGEMPGGIYTVYALVQNGVRWESLAARRMESVLCVPVRNVNFVVNEMLLEGCSPWHSWARSLF